MAIIATVRKHDTWEGLGTVGVKQFNSNGLAKKDPIEAAKGFAVEHGYIDEFDGDHILVIESATHSYTLWPTYLSKNNYELSWQIM